jgi:hypothetical protein
MNCIQANRLPIKEIVESFGLTEGLFKGYEIWYRSPFRSEDKPSFKINTKTNRWYDFGKSSKAGGTVIDFIVELKQCSINEALAFIDSSGRIPTEFNRKPLFSFPEQAAKKTGDVVEQTKNLVPELKLEILNIKPLNNPALLQYLSLRKVNTLIAQKYIQEIYIRNNHTSKTYFALCFKNDSGGYEWRNKYMRGVMGNKDITHIKVSPNSTKFALFEGFIDFVSYLTYLKDENPLTDYIILNSVTMINKAVSLVKDKGYTDLYLYLDNDEAGDIAVNQLQELLKVNLHDQRSEYKSFKDFNDFLVSKHINTKT